MAKRNRSYTKSFTLPLAVAAPIGLTLIGPAQKAMAGDYMGALDELAWKFTGINRSTGQFDMNALKQGLLPVVGGLLVHKFVGGKPLNLNRAIANAGIPFIRI